MPATLTARESRRVDWDAIKDRISIEAVAVSLLGPAEGRNGARGLWWSCPFHEDRNPSFQASPERGSWKCWAGCGSGDAIDLVRRRERLTFPEAVERLAEMFCLDGGNPGPAASPRSRPPSPSRKRQAEPSGVSPAESLERRQWAEKRLCFRPGCREGRFQRKSRASTPPPLSPTDIQGGCGSRETSLVPRGAEGVGLPSGARLHR